MWKTFWLPERFVRKIGILCFLSAGLKEKSAINPVENSDSTNSGKFGALGQNLKNRNDSHKLRGTTRRFELLTSVS